MSDGKDLGQEIDWQQVVKHLSQRFKSLAHDPGFSQLCTQVRLPYACAGFVGVDKATENWSRAWDAAIKDSADESNLGQSSRSRRKAAPPFVTKMAAQANPSIPDIRIQLERLLFKPSFTLPVATAVRPALADLLSSAAKKLLSGGSLQSAASSALVALADLISFAPFLLR